MVQGLPIRQPGCRGLVNWKAQSLRQPDYKPWELLPGITLGSPAGGRTNQMSTKSSAIDNIGNIAKRICGMASAADRAGIIRKLQERVKFNRGAGHSAAVKGVKGNTIAGIVPSSASKKQAAGGKDSDADAKVGGKFKKGPTYHCKLGPLACPTCKWAKLHTKWQRKLPMRLANGTTSFWLAALPGSQIELRVGCLACGKAELNGNFGQFRVHTLKGLQFENFTHHSNLQSHQRAVAALSLRHPGCEGDMVTAPLISQFRTIWNKAKRSTSVRGMEDPAQGIFRQKTSQKMYCLGEAVREKCRKSFREGKHHSATLSQDAAKGRLLVRFMNADEELHTRSGILGLQRNYGSGHKCTVKATQKAISDFCTPLHGAPYGRADFTPRLDDALYETVRKSFEIWNTDAASEELLSGKEAKRMSFVGDDNVDVPLLPNIQIINRDKAHASRRVLKTPWKANEYLESVYVALFGRKQSFVKIIQYSKVIKPWYEEFQDEMPDQRIQAVKDLGQSSVRFDSIAKPMCRFTLTFSAMVMTANKVWTLRRGLPVGTAAREFLELLDSKTILSTGMLADAADEGLLLTRVMDDEDSVA